MRLLQYIFVTWFLRDATSESQSPELRRVHKLATSMLIGFLIPIIVFILMLLLWHPHPTDY
jgi:hypothetical protein